MVTWSRHGDDVTVFTQPLSEQRMNEYSNSTHALLAPLFGLYRGGIRIIASSYRMFYALIGHLLHVLSWCGQSNIYWFNVLRPLLCSTCCYLIKSFTIHLDSHLKVPVVHKHFSETQRKMGKYWILIYILLHKNIQY